MKDLTARSIYAHRVVIETDDQGRPTNLPAFPPRARVEATFLVLEEGSKAATDRRPPASLASLKILGDIVAPAIDHADRAMTT